MALQNLFVMGLGLLSGKSVWNHFIAALAMFNEEMEVEVWEISCIYSVIVAG
jgi:hypothetical protein